MDVVVVAESGVDAMQCFTLGADSLLTKPFRFGAFERAMRRLGLFDRLEFAGVSAALAPR